MGGGNKENTPFFKLAKALGLEEFCYDEEVQEKLKKAKAGKDYEAISSLSPYSLTENAVSQLAKIATLAEVGVIREDLLLELHALITRERKEGNLLEDFKEVLEGKHYQALLFSHTIKNFEDNTFSDRVEKLNKVYEKRYGDPGKKIYNWHRSGYIKSYFHYQLCYTKYEFEKGYPDKFRLFFNKQLEYFDKAVWTNRKMTDEEIEKEMLRRLKDRRKVTVYARGEFLIYRPFAFSKITEQCSNGRRLT